MVERARWILIGTAMMLVAGALSWSCGGGSSSGSCEVLQGGVYVNLCSGVATPGPVLQNISLCPGTPVTPTPVATSTASTSPTPMETTCANPLPTTVVPVDGTVYFHAVGTYSDKSTQDITNNASTTWTSNDPTVLEANTGTPGPGSSTGPGTFFATGIGTADVNATSAGISAPEPGAPVEVVPSATPSITPAATPSASPTATPDA